MITWGILRRSHTKSDVPQHLVYDEARKIEHTKSDVPQHLVYAEARKIEHTKSDVPQFLAGPVKKNM